jgi:hypothetical protein
MDDRTGPILEKMVAWSVDRRSRINLRPELNVTRKSLAVPWMLLHACPLLLVALVTHGLHSAIGIDNAAAVTHLVILSWIAAGETYLLRGVLERPRAWAWRTACGLALGMIAGLMVMSTIDLRGSDAAATVLGMLATGLVFGALQASAQRLSAMRWILASAAGWVFAAIVLRTIVMALTGLSVGGVSPFGLAYSSGHNELLWSAVGLAGHGIATAWNVEALGRAGGEPMRPVAMTAH